MKAVQLYGIMMMLISNGFVTRADIMRRFGIGERTVRRYIEDLRAADVPVRAEMGLRGGYYIPEDYKISVAMFTDEEMARIRTCLTALSGTFKDDVNEMVLDKLAAVTGSTTKDLVVDFDSWHGGDAMSARMDAIAAAMRNSVTVEMEYTDRNGSETRRLFDPYCIAIKDGVRYVYGWCRLHGGFRTFRLARIKSVALTERTFARRADADVTAALSVKREGNVPLVLELEESARAGVEEWLGASAVTREGGGLVARASVYGGGETIRRILSFGSAVRVVSPTETAEKTAEEAARIAEKYSGSV